MKIKCPFCKQSYTLKDADLLGYGWQDLECGGCASVFNLREVVKCYYEYREILLCQRRISEIKEQLKAEKQNLKEYKKRRNSYFDCGIDRADVEDNISRLERHLDYFQNQNIDELKLAYQYAIDELDPGEPLGDSRDEADALLAAGILAAVPNETDMGILARTAAMGNGWTLREYVVNARLRVYLAAELAAICDRLITAPCLPIPDHEYQGGGDLTPKQYGRLCSFGFDAEDVIKLGFQDASWVLDMIYNKYDAARWEWIYQFSTCDTRDQLLDKIAHFNSDPVITPMQE